MRLTLRPYVIAGAALVGAGVIVLAPAAPPLPNIQVPAVQPAGSEVSGFSQQDLLGMLANLDDMFPDTQGLNSPAESPYVSVAPSPPITPPELGPMDLGGLDLSGQVPGTVAGP